VRKRKEKIVPFCFCRRKQERLPASVWVSSLEKAAENKKFVKGKQQWRYWPLKLFCPCSVV
jgi:hypothetical protein